jgi:hypothetical protein
MPSLRDTANSRTENKLIAALQQWTFPTSPAGATINTGNGSSVVYTSTAADDELPQLLPPPIVSLGTFSEVIGGSTNGDRVWMLDVDHGGRIVKVQLRLSNVSCSLDAQDLADLETSDLVIPCVQINTNPTATTTGTTANQGQLAGSTRSDYSSSVAHETVRRLTLRMIDAFGRSLLESSALLDLAQFESPEFLEYGDGDESMAAVLLHERILQKRHQQQRGQSSGEGTQTDTSASLPYTSDESLSEAGFVLDASLHPEAPTSQQTQRTRLQHSISDQRNSLATPCGTNIASSCTAPLIEISPPLEVATPTPRSTDLEYSLAESLRQLRAELLRNLHATVPGVDPMVLVTDPQEITHMIRSKIASARRRQASFRINDSSTLSEAGHHQPQESATHDAEGRGTSMCQFPQRGSSLDNPESSESPSEVTAGHNSPTSVTSPTLPFSPRLEEAMRYLLTKYFADPDAQQPSTM